MKFWVLQPMKSRTYISRTYLVASSLTKLSCGAGPFLSEDVGFSTGLLWLLVERGICSHLFGEGPIVFPDSLGKISGHSFLLVLNRRAGQFFCWEDGRYGWELLGFPGRG